MIVLLKRWLGALEQQLTPVPRIRRCGHLTRATGLVMEASSLQLPLGCRVERTGGDDNAEVECEVVGFNSNRLFLIPLEKVEGIVPEAEMVAAGHEADHSKQLPLGHALLGRVLDSRARPLDGQPAPNTLARAPLITKPYNPLQRTSITDVLDIRVRAINGMLTIGRGQPIWLFAGSWVGKSVLLGIMARYSRSDVIVVGLIGDRGQNVLLIMDSLTRYAKRSGRSRWLSANRQPLKGIPHRCSPDCLPLVGRAGNSIGAGSSITAFYTVLTEGDDRLDPIADSTRAILDGHIVLSRSLMESGHYPAIDIEASISRVMTALITPEQTPGAPTETAAIALPAQPRFDKRRRLCPLLDQEIALYPAIEGFLQQGMHQTCGYDDALQQSQTLFAPA